MNLLNTNLRKLGCAFNAAMVNEMLDGDQPSAFQAMGVQAGIVAGLFMALPSAEFEAVMSEWEVDKIKISECLQIAGISDNETDIEV